MYLPPRPNDLEGGKQAAHTRYSRLSLRRLYEELDHHRKRYDTFTPLLHPTQVEFMRGVLEGLQTLVTEKEERMERKERRDANQTT